MVKSKSADNDLEAKSELNILMLTSHIYDSKKKAGFHHLANSLLNMGHNLTFCTVPNSVLEILNSLIKLFSRSFDLKTCCNQFLTVYYAIVPKRQGKLTKTSYISLLYNFRDRTLFISALYKFRPIIDLDSFLLKIFLNGYSKVFSNNYDIIFFESNVGLFLYDKLKKLNPNAKYIYRISDDLELLGDVKILTDYEKTIMNKFDLISSSSSVITNKINSYIPHKIKIITQNHGIDPQIFDRDYLNPYDKTKKNFVFVGTGFMDEKFLKIVAGFSQNWVFHIIGSLPKSVVSQNIIYYGEMPFDKTIPFLKFADIGLQIRSYSKGIETLEKSLKFIQYTYLKLPIIAPKYMNLTDKHVFSYEHSIESIENAIIQALNFDRELIDRSELKTWDKIVKEMLFFVKADDVYDI